MINQTSFHCNVCSCSHCTNYIFTTDCTAENKKSEWKFRPKNNDENLYFSTVNVILARAHLSYFCSSHKYSKNIRDRASIVQCRSSVDQAGLSWVSVLHNEIGVRTQLICFYRVQQSIVASIDRQEDNC